MGYLRRLIAIVPCRSSTHRPLLECPTNHPVLLHQGQTQHFRPQGRPPIVAANGGDRNSALVGPVPGLSKPPGPAAPSTPGAAVVNHGPPTGPLAPNSSRGAPRDGHISPGTTQQQPKGGATPVGPAAASVPTATSNTPALIQAPIVPRRIVCNNTSGRGSGGGGGELARSLSGASDGRGGVWGASPAATAGGAGAVVCRPVTATGGGWHALRDGVVPWFRNL